MARIFVCICLLYLAGCSGNAKLETSAPQPEMEEFIPNREAIYGNWEVVKATLYGEQDTDREGCTVKIGNDGMAEWPKGQGSEPVEFQIMNSNADGSIPFQIAGSEDLVSMGGAGPRNGLLRFLRTDEVEIIEATSANEPAPNGFDDATIGGCGYMHLKRIQ